MRRSFLLLATTALALWFGSCDAFDTFVTFNMVENITWSVWEGTDANGNPVFNITEPYNSTAPFNTTLVGTVIYNKSLEEQGWDFVQVFANDAATVNQYYVGGYGEGFVTFERLRVVYEQQGTYPVTVDEDAWIDAHIAYMQEQAYFVNNTNLGFWNQLANLLSQLQGLADGYTAAAALRNLPGLTFKQIFLMNFATEIGDVQLALGAGLGAQQKPFARKGKRRNQHCSALIKVTSEDLFVAQDTWDVYENTIRMFKVYVFDEASVAFSSMAGMIASGDDFYITSNGLATIETTLGNNNASLAAEYVVPATVSEFLRVMIANYVGTSGPHWVDLFQYNNSGTYCNQWMVVNYNLYSAGTPASQLSPNLLWVAEEMPGNVTSADVTEYLVNFSYWGSYNIPFFSNIYTATEAAPAPYEAYSFFSWNNTPRAEMFRRNNSDVVDLPSLQALMRYNNWEADALSTIPDCDNCSPATSPMLAIASRGDLVPVNATLPGGLYGEFFGRSAFGAVDCKVTSSEMIALMQAVAISGPTTYNGQPIFSWTGPFADQRPPDAPFQYNFTWQQYNQIVPPHGYFGGLFDTWAVAGGVIGATLVLFVIAGVGVYRCRGRRIETGEDERLNRQLDSELP